MTGYFERLQEAFAGLDQEALDRLLAFVRDCTGTLWICGNGGSASTAQHWAGDLSKAAGRRAQALGCNSALLTAWANDVAYERALAEEFRVLARPGDRLICLSCSGASPNIIAVLAAARAERIATALLTGKRGGGGLSVGVLVRVPSEDYGIIEDCHLAIAHALVKALREQL